MFQRRHYVKIAEIVASLPEPLREKIAIRFAAELIQTNPRFDTPRFLAAALGSPINRRDKPADSTGSNRTEVIRQALALIKAAHKAREEGKHVGLG